MAEKQKLGIIDEHSKKLESLRQERQALKKDLYKGLDTVETIFENLGTAKRGKVEGELTKIDQGLAKYGDYKQTIADLSEGLTENLSDYVKFAAEGQNYQGIEKLLAIIPFTHKMANRKRIERLRTQSPRDNLQLILNYGEQLFKEICEVREDAVNTYGRLQANADVITTKIAEYEPKEEALKEKLDTLEKAYKEKEDIYKAASPQEQAKLINELNEMNKQLTEIRNEYDQVFTIYNQAQQALEANKQSRDAFEKMVRDLGRQATMVKEKIDNVTEIYLAAPEAVKIMMTTKGMESLDKAVNAATDRSVDIITQAAQSVSDATLAREEIQLIDEKVMKGYMDRMETTMREFNERYDKIRADAQRSQQERYKSE
jgi:chromosome segregation ATPase